MNNPLIAARAEFAAAFPEKRVSVNAREWGVIDTAQSGAHNAPCLLLIPGTLGRATVFWQQIQALAGTIRLLSVSYPAEGGIADWADDLIALMDARAIARTAVLGSSLGGYVAQYLAATQPDRITHLFAANTLSSVLGINDRPPYALDLFTAPIADLRAGFRGGLAAWRRAHPEQGDLVELLLTDVEGGIPEAELRRRLHALKSAPDLPDDPRPAQQTTILESDDDPLIPPARRAAVRARFAQSDAFRFAHGGHFPYVARPEVYTALIRARLGLGALPDAWRTSVA